MAQVKSKIKGEYTYPSEYSEVPDGGLLLARNVNIDRDSIAEPRRGFNTYKAISASSNDRADAFLFYKNAFFTHYGTSLSKDGTDPFTLMTGTFAAPSHGDSYVPRIKYIEANSNLYFTSNTGIQKLDDPANSIVKAGAPRGLDVNLTLTGASGFMANNVQVAYRVLWGYRDANQNVILGAPSQRAVISNTTGGTRNVIVNTSIPQEATTNWFYQVYRTDQSIDQNTDPGDEEGLVYESNPSSGDISNKFIQFTDSTTDDLRGATIYTAPSQQGISQANDTPPSAKDLCLFKNCTLFANTIQKQSLTITLLAAGGTSGVGIGDTITIGGVVFTGSAAEDTTLGHFIVSTGGSPSQNIYDTANSLVKCVNRYASSTAVYAYYFSTADQLPGQIFLEARSLGASAFTVIASAHSQAWNPALPTGGSTVISSAEEKMNRLHVSKVQQPEGCPRAQYFEVGAGNKAFLRVVPLRDSVILMKEDGFFRLTGTTPQNFQIDPLDLTTYVIGPETVRPLNNQVYAITNQGISTASDTGIGVISRPIEDQILPKLAFSNFKTVAFAEAYETERKYILFTPNASSDTFAKLQNVYNTFTSAWTSWDKPATFAAVNPADNKLYLSSSSSNKILQERKNLDITDFSDEDVTVTISTIVGLVFTLSSATGISVGDYITQTTGSFVANGRITGVDLSTNKVTLDNDPGFSTGSATVKTSYLCTVSFTAQYCGNPGLMKHIREVHALLKEAQFQTASLEFSSDAVQSTDFVSISGFPSFAWGEFPWGTVPWGGYDGLTKFRTWPPLEYQRCTWQNVTWKIQEARSKFALSGLEFTFEPMTERTGT